MALKRPIMAAFDQGAVPTIACVNLSTMDLGVDFDSLVSALQSFTDDCFAPVWGAPAKLIKATNPVAGAWTIVFLDDADAPNALGYHDLTKNGLPLSKVFVKPTLRNHDKVSVTACHELAEMLIDPAINLWSDGPNGTLYAYEMCDAVEEEEFVIDGVALSDFVYPSYFELFRKANSAQYDYLKKISQPFEVLRGGYSIVRDGTEIKQIFGSREKELKFSNEDRTEHRSQYRVALLETKPANSAKLRADDMPKVAPASRSRLNYTGSSLMDAAHGMSHDIPRPPIKQCISSPNFSSRNGVAIDMVVLHYTDGPSAQSAINHFLDQASQVSAHYIIDKNGDIYQMVRDSEKAWHAKAANPRSIGIEHVAEPGDEMTPDQTASSVALIKWLMATYDISLDGITGHRFAPGNIGTTDCPDHLFGDASKAAIESWKAQHLQ